MIEHLKDRLPLLRNFWFQWILANLIGWTAGLWGGLLLATRLSGIGLLGWMAGGALTGTVVGYCQAAVLWDRVDLKVGRWIGLSAMAGAIAATTIPFSAGLVYPLGWFATEAASGAWFGALLGSVQAIMLRQRFKNIHWTPWVIFAGALCGLFSLPITQFHLIVTVMIGPALFGIITGIPLSRALQASEKS